MQTHAFRAMNTQFHLWTDGQGRGAAEALREAEHFVREVEETLSRFLPTSALSQVNRAPGRWHRVPPIMAEIVELALAWAQRTDGLFDPTILGALYASGYTLSFERIQKGGALASAGTWRPAGAWTEVRVEGDSLYVPPHTGLDLGGIAKEWTADRVASALSSWGGCLVDAGGDIRAIGAPWMWGQWPVAVAHPLDPEKDILRLGLQGGAITTSSRARRRWRLGKRMTHHIIDPRTGLAAQTPIVSATVLAPTAVMGGVLSKVILITGVKGLNKLQHYPGCQGLVVLDDGRIHYSNTWEVADVLQ